MYGSDPNINECFDLFMVVVFNVLKIRLEIET